MIAELPGVDKEGIKIKASSLSLRISAKNTETKRSYFKKIKMISPIDPSSSSAKYTNGVLEVTVKKGKLDEKICAIRIE